MPSLRFIIHCDMSVSLFGFPTKKNDRLNRMFKKEYIDKFRVVEVLGSRHAHSIPQDFEECVTFPKKKAVHDLMKPPRLSLAISMILSITPVPAIIRTCNTSMAIMICIEFQVCCTMVKMIHPNTTRKNNLGLQKRITKRENA